MEVTYNQNFESERERYSFCFTCEQCAHFDENAETCLHGYPCHMHRLMYYKTVPKPPTILFCKDFDLA